MNAPCQACGRVKPEGEWCTCPRAVKVMKAYEDMIRVEILGLRPKRKYPATL